MLEGGGLSLSFEWGFYALSASKAIYAASLVRDSFADAVVEHYVIKH